MKIRFTKHGVLTELGERRVKPGDVAESSHRHPARLLRAYVQNGIAVEVTQTKKKKEVTAHGS